MTAINLLFPHQLFAQHDLYSNGHPVYLVEEYLFFRQYKFHKQKIAFHRASMKCHAAALEARGLVVHYINAHDTPADVRDLLPFLAKKGVQTIHSIDTTDYLLERRLNRMAKAENIQLIRYDNPLFLNTKDELNSFFKEDKKSFFQTTFYKQQRVKRRILIDEKDKPFGEKWSFDGDNRKKYPKGKVPPAVHYPAVDAYWKEAVVYVNEHFSAHLGTIATHPIFPFSEKETTKWLHQFFEYRFHQFGDYEDAIMQKELVLNHSVLSPMMNVGLIAPQTIIDAALAFAAEQDVPLNSLEGFIRQIIGWREFIRGMYEIKGVESRTKNFWGYKRTIPASFYDGTTGILPVDDVIKKVLKTGYCHHIERLMVLGNFMLLCEFHPDAVYQWFMELFIDAYDWVMVPNVYGMSQFADGGFFATKPYISGSNYILKMSNYKKGNWQTAWDGLFWRFMHVNQDFFLKNPRLGMLVRMYDKMSTEKQEAHLKAAETFLAKL